MGAELSTEQPHVKYVPTEVKLIVYDLDASAEIFVLNQLLRPLGTGVFHCGVQVLGQEWSFRGTRGGGTGVFCCKPGNCANLKPREYVKLGTVMLPEGKVASVLEDLKSRWPGRGYDMLRRNCSHFCDEFVQQLGVGPLPTWVKNMAKTGADLSSMGSQLTSALDRMVEPLNDLMGRTEAAAKPLPVAVPPPPKLMGANGSLSVRSKSFTAKPGPTLLTGQASKELMRRSYSRPEAEWVPCRMPELVEDEAVQCGCF